MSELKNIPDGWIETEIGNLVDLAQGVAINAKTDYVLCDKENGIPLLKINNLLNNTIDQYANPELVPKQSIINKNDIIFTRTGQVGAVLFNKYGILHNNSFKVIPKDEIYWKYLYWYLKSERVYNYVQKVAAGSVQKDLNHSAFKTIEFKYPKNKEEQKSIAEILTSFDDKIELLQAQNKTLEETAQTIFAEWFGKYSVDDELPEGWRVGKLGDLVEKISKGTTATKDDLSGLDGEIPFLKVKDISNDGLILKTNLELIPKSVHENQLKRSILETNDILFSIAGTIGRLAIVDLEMNNANCNQALAFIRLKDKCIHLEYIHLWLKSKETQDVIISNIVQGVQANVSLTVLGNLLLLIPNSETITNWCKLIKPIYLKLQTNTEQIQTLTKTRDELLPRLMSGEVRVSEL